MGCSSCGKSKTKQSKPKKASTKIKVVLKKK